MKFAYTADWHLSGYTQDKIVNGLPERLYEKKVVQENIANYCRLNEIKTIVIGGDLLHNKSIIYSLAQSILLDFFREYKDLDFIVIDGNHDLSGKGSDVVSALKSLDNEPNVRRISKATRITDESGLDILIVPYSDDMINIIKNSSAKYLISHFGLNEGTLNSGVSIISDIGLKDLIGKYQTVLLGHYHKPQEIIKNGIELYYSGSITQNDWGEKEEEKRFLIVDTETGLVQSIPTTGYRKYFDLQITSENKEEVIKKARELKEEGHNVKITRKEEVDIDDINKEFMVIDKVEKDITNRGLTSSMSIADKINRYTEINKIPEAKREMYFKEAMDIINAVSGRK
jgi:DNA repair exonuclease SbcCD nuclease subunit